MKIFCQIAFVPKLIKTKYFFRHFIFPETVKITCLYSQTGSLLYNEMMRENLTITVAEAAEILGCTKSYVQRLIRQERLVADLQDAPVKYYLLDPASVHEYKITPKDKGGRPPKKAQKQ